MLHKRKLLAAVPTLLCLLLLASCATQIPPSRLPTADEESLSTIPLSPKDMENASSDTEPSLPVAPVSITLKNVSPLTGIDTGTVTGAGSYTPGSQVTLTATPRILGYQFGGWYLQNERLSTQATYNFTAPPQSIELTAMWIPRDDIADFTFTATADECIITGLKNPNKTELIIPDYVTELAPAAFRGCTSLTVVAIPEGISYLPDSLFEGCNALTDLSYSHTFESIGQNAFLGCDSLRCSTYGNTRYLAGETPFSWLIGLTDPSVTECAVHPDTQSIAKGAFMNSPSLQSVTFPASSTVTELPAYAFSDCPSLRQIILPPSLQAVGENAFAHCSDLDNVRYLGTVEQWESISLGETNRLLELTPIHCEDGDSIYPIRLYGRSLLFGEDAYLYDLIEAAVMAPTPLSSVSVDPTHCVTAEQCSEAYDVFLHDYPECFWAGNSLSFSTNADTGAVLEITFEYIFQGNELAAAKEALNAVVEEILRDMPEGTPFEQTLYLHDAVAERVTYRPNPLDQTSYGALVGGEAVCAGYAGAYQLLLQSAGYKAWSVSGFAGEPHRWNVVWLDHRTCVYTDVTWDDSESFPISHGYFGLSLEEIGEDHIPNAPDTLPACGHDAHSHADRSEIPAVSDASPISTVYPTLTQQNEGYLAVFYYTGNDLEAWVGNHLHELASHLGWHSISVSYRAVRNEIFLTMMP